MERPASSSRMPSIAITGSIGSGKSLATASLITQFERTGIPLCSFSADRENRRLLASDDEVRLLVIEKLGKETYDKDGNPDRKEIFRIISSDESGRLLLESIMHPRLQAIWKPLAESFGKQKDSYFVAEIPLLFEKDLSRYFDRAVVVACSAGIRKKRLQLHRRISDEEMERWESMQLPQDQKVSLADHLIWNDGNPSSLESQSNQLLNLLTLR